MTMKWMAAWLSTLIVALSACATSSGDSDQDSNNPEAVTTSIEQPVESTVSNGGEEAAATSCAEAYSPAAVARRSFAFDGIVVDVGPSVSDRGDGGVADMNLPGVTFEVQEWFEGETDADTVTVDMQIPRDEFSRGTRLLVSGEARWGGQPLAKPIAWGCGFTLRYDEDSASAWRMATSS